MSPASYLTAPPRDAASIVAPSGRKVRGYDGRNGASHLDFLAVSGRRGRRIDSRRRDPRAADLARLQALLAHHLVRDRRRPRVVGDDRGARRAARREVGAADRSARPPRAVAGRARGDPGSGVGRAVVAVLVPRSSAAQVTRVAAIDLGTNATRLLVADVEDGRVEEVQRRTTITKLG